MLSLRQCPHPCLNQNNEERIDETEQKPDFNIFDRGGGGEAARDRDVESRKNHHTCDVDRDDITEEIITVEIVGRLVDDIHEDCW